MAKPKVKKPKAKGANIPVPAAPSMPMPRGVPTVVAPPRPPAAPQLAGLRARLRGRVF